MIKVHLGIVLLFFSCSPKLQTSSESNLHLNMLHYVFNLPDAPNKKPVYLDINYQGANEFECHISFRLFYSLNNVLVTFDADSPNYITLFTVSPACNDKFRFPLSKIISLEPLQKQIYFSIIPFDLDGGEIKRNLAKNFRLSLSTD